MSFQNGYILQANFSEELKWRLNSQIESEKVWFHFDSLLIDDARKIVEEAYRSEVGGKTIFLETKKIPPTSQNALLKILEEPPRNVQFIVIVPSKSILLPTVRSRLPLKVEKSEKRSSENIPLLDLNRIDLNTLNRFIKFVEEREFSENLQVVEKILERNVEYQFSEKDLERFSTAYQLLTLHSKPSRVFLMLLLPFVFGKR
jgi:DNA polymerase-3 subunit delta'